MIADSEAVTEPRVLAGGNEKPFFGSLRAKTDPSRLGKLR